MSNKLLNDARSKHMQRAIEQASYLETKSGHKFGIANPSNSAVSPKLSPAGQYYFPCTTCGRCVFENGTGSAVTSACER